MELLTATVLLAVFLCSSAPRPSVVAPADCSDAEIEKDAGRALNLINKHRREGYVFTLLRVADAHVQHAGNVSILYFTLDVVDTECPVLSRKEWTSCRHRVFYPNTEFGQCKAVLYKNSLFKKAELFEYNCTISPVPPELYECKDCVVKVTNLLDVDSYTDEAKKILEKHSRESNETQGFRVEKVKKAFSMVGSRKGHHVEFTIIEADGPKAGFPKNNASERSFPPERQRHTGFCIGRVVQELEIVEVVSCVIYDIPHGQHPFHHHHHHHVHNDSGPGEFYHCCKVSGQNHGPPPPGPSHKDRPQHHHRQHHHRHSHDGSGEFNHRCNVSRQDRETSPPGPPHKDEQQQHRHRHHRPRPHYRHSHDGSGEFNHRCNVSRQDRETSPLGPPHKDEQQQHRHRHHRPRPHYRHSHDGSGELYHCCNMSGQINRFPPPPPPPHHRHSHNDSEEFYHRCNMSGEECGPPPSGPPQRDNDHHHHPPDRCHHCRSSCPPDAPCDHASLPHFHRHGHYHHHHFHDRRCKNAADEQRGFSSEDHGSFQHHHPFHHSDGDSVYYISVLSQDYVIKTPGANFLDHHPHGPHRRSKKRFFSCGHTDKNPVVQPFPETPSKSKCPGNLKFQPPKGLLSLYPSKPKH